MVKVKDKEKQKAKEWSDDSEASQRKATDDAMSGGTGRSLPGKDAKTKGNFLDKVDDPHGEMRRHESAQAVREREAARREGASMSVWGAPVLREGQSAWRAFEPRNNAGGDRRLTPPPEERNESSSRRNTGELT
jgi:hypothetical protein